jgi:hypothetical protein
MNQPSPLSAPASVQPERCGLAVWSLVLGILGIVLCVLAPLFAIPAVICGHVALGRIKRAAGSMDGSGLAIGGLVTGYAGIALIPVVLLLAAIAVPNFVRARDVAMMNQCRSNLRMLDGAKQQWALEHGKRSESVPTAAELAPYLKQGGGTMPICAKGGIYQLNAVSQSPTCSIPGHQLD